MVAPIPHKVAQTSVAREDRERTFWLSPLYHPQTLNTLKTDEQWAEQAKQNQEEMEFFMHQIEDALGQQPRDNEDED